MPTIASYKEYVFLIFLKVHLSCSVSVSLQCWNRSVVCFVCVLVSQSCPTLCDPMDCSLPGSSVRGILQARILEWVAVPFCRGSSLPRDQTQVSCIAGRFFTILSYPGSSKFGLRWNSWLALRSHVGWNIYLYVELPLWFKAK